MSTLNKAMKFVKRALPIIGVIALFGLMFKSCRYDDVKPTVTSPTGNATQCTTDSRFVDYTVTIPLVNLADSIITDVHGNLFCIYSSASGIYSFYTKDAEGGYHLHAIPASMVTIYQQDNRHDIVIIGSYCSILSSIADDSAHYSINDGDFERYLSSMEELEFPKPEIKKIALFVPEGTIIESYSLDAS